MKIFTGALGNIQNTGRINTVLLNKQKNMLRLIKAQPMTVEEFANKTKSGRTMVTCKYIDIITAEVDLPPVTDKRTLNILIKNKLQNVLLPEIEYTFTYHEISARDTGAENQQSQQKASAVKNYVVYAIPSGLISQYPQGDKLRKKLAFLTLDQFALVALSERVDPKKLICHAYADESQILLTFSQGSTLLYSRVTAIPKNINNKPDLINFYYETINLTYLYIRQSRQLTVDAIIFSGLLKEESGLERSVEIFANLKISYLDVKKYIKNCNPHQFNTNLLAIGCALADKNANFLPVADSELRAYKDVLFYVNTALALLVVAAGLFMSTKIMQYFEMRDDILWRTDRLNAQLNELDAVIGNKTELTYFDAYIRNLYKREQSPVNLMVKSQDLLARDLYDSIAFISDPDTGQNTVALRKLEEFDTYTATFMFHSKYNQYLAVFEKQRQLMPAINSILKIPQRAYDINTDLLKTRAE